MSGFKEIKPSSVLKISPQPLSLTRNPWLVEFVQMDSLSGGCQECLHKSAPQSSFKPAALGCTSTQEHLHFISLPSRFLFSQSQPQVLLPCLEPLFS